MRVYGIEKLMAKLNLMVTQRVAYKVTTKHKHSYAFWDTTVVEPFFGSLKHDLLLKVPQPTRENMKKDVAAFVRYYNLERLCKTNRDLSPVEYGLEQLNSLRKVS